MGIVPRSARGIFVIACASVARFSGFFFSQAARLYSRAVCPLAARSCGLRLAARRAAGELCAGGDLRASSADYEDAFFALVTPRGCVLDGLLVL